jgi:hypothetical protein
MINKDITLAIYGALRGMFNSAQIITLLYELETYRNGGVTEEILRRNDGSIKVGKGCKIVRDETP